MQTRCYNITDIALQRAKIEEAAAVIRAGGLVAMPTETVYGLGCSAFDPAAISRVFAAKGRPQDNPLIVHIAALSQLQTVCSVVPSDALALAARFWPGPMTMILPKSASVPPEVTAGLDTVAVRFPSHPVANALIAAAGVPIAAPSANLSGSPSPTTAQHVKNDLDGRIDLILDGGPCKWGLESTVIDLCSHPYALLRPGSVTLSDLQNVLPETVADKALFHDVAPGEKVRSPGMKHRHYAPHSPLTAIMGGGQASSEYIFTVFNPDTDAVLCFDEFLPRFKKVPCVAFGPEADYRAQARQLFAALRLLDENRYACIYAQCPPEIDASLAVVNRLKRAAGFHIVNV